MSVEGNGGAVPLVQPSPVVESVQVGQVVGSDGKPVVVISFHGPTGSSIHFLGGGAAQAIGAELVRLGTTTAAGLIVPGGPA